MAKSDQIRTLSDARRLQLLIDAVVDYAIYLIDLEGRVLSWNSGARRLKGYETEEVVGESFSRFYTPEDRDQGLPWRALNVAAQAGRFESEGWRMRKDGSRFWALAVVDAVYGEDGRLIGFAKVTRDLTDRHEAQQALTMAQERLAVSQKMEAIGQLSGGVAHDFNNLMMIVQGNLESAQRNLKKLEGDTSNLERSLRNAMRGAQRAAALTSRLLAFSRRQPLDPKPLDVNRFLTGAADFLQRSLGEMIDVEIVGAAGLWPIEVDANQLEAAIVNLAINARDAMASGGKITIEAANVFLDEAYARSNPEISSGQFVVICVADTGTGMPPEVIDRAFEPFFTTKEPGQGTGLGLSQVYGFVKQSGGHIKIYSEPGQGTTVKIYFPRLLAREMQAEDEPAEPVAHGEQGETILLVEDDRDLRDYMAEVLRGLKYNVLAAPDAESALDIVERRHLRIDLLLTDVVMPGMNGRQLAKKLEELRPRMPVLFMTGYSRNAIVHHGRLDPGVDVLQKPVSQNNLAARVRAALDRHRTSSGS